MFNLKQINPKSYKLLTTKAYVRLISITLLTISIILILGCGGQFSRLRNINNKDDTPQPLLEQEYHKSDYWGGANGIYISVDKRNSKIGGQSYASVKIMNHSGVNLSLNVKSDHYWFKRFGSKYSLYRRTGSRYPPKISNTRELKFDLVGIETFANVDSISFIFVEMDSLIITTTEKK
ncbi:MAG: hypothetical protein IIB39_03035 [Candidatus Marinimicrobia bacterium]|nr:hypothetical protein [Candidatus Neomarinimicrobiota bacterium]